LGEVSLEFGKTLLRREPAQGRTPIQNAALYTAGVIFAAGAVGHVVRLIRSFEFVIDGFVVPVWVSYPGAFIAALLAVWMVVAARRS
jgi:hypothetical protein